MDYKARGDVPVGFDKSAFSRAQFLLPYETGSWPGSLREFESNSYEFPNDKSPPSTANYSH